MLKVAVIDKTFFSRGSHPARRLLNEIASAAMGWGDQDEAQRDSLYQKIEQIVARLLNDFVDDPAIFSELLADFLAFMVTSDAAANCSSSAPVTPKRVAPKSLARKSSTR